MCREAGERKKWTKRIRKRHLRFFASRRADAGDRPSCGTGDAIERMQQLSAGSERLQKLISTAIHSVSVRDIDCTCDKRLRRRIADCERPDPPHGAPRADRCSCNRRRTGRRFLIRVARDAHTHTDEKETKNGC